MSRLLLVACACWLVPSPAFAQSEPTPRAITMPPHGRVRVTARWDSYLHTGTVTQAEVIFGGGPSFIVPETVTYTSWSNVLSVDVDVGDALFRATAPMSYELVERSGFSTFPPFRFDQAELGDLSLEGLANADLGLREHRLLIGGGVSLPTATDPGSGLQVRLVAWETSFRNAPLWVDQAIGVWPTVDYRFAIPWLWVSAVMTVPVFFPLAATGGPQPLSRGSVEVMVDIDANVALRVLDTVDVGVSFLAWALPSGAVRDPHSVPWIDLGQTALTLSVRSDPLLDAPVFGGAELILDLDGRWGPTGAPGKLWGLHAFLGARIDV